MSDQATFLEPPTMQSTDSLPVRACVWVDNADWCRVAGFDIRNNPLKRAEAWRFLPALKLLGFHA